MSAADELTLATRMARAAWHLDFGDPATAAFIEHGEDDASSTFAIIRAFIAFDRDNGPERGSRTLIELAAAINYDREHRAGGAS